ncbi:unnamed protein product [Moneuplotes crassus]|uniref:RING-type domain-containing protein n=1 Tax=Euplotes crassus TaxID=5936 RepID=A0AAD2D1P1_EUPCR|nr:unnamed protein product [Moneuplotes crassus]
MNSLTKRYYCHSCKAEFREEQGEEVRCSRCSSIFCEEADQDYSEESECKDRDEIEAERSNPYSQGKSFNLEDVIQAQPDGNTQRVIRIENNMGTVTLDGMFNGLADMLGGVLGNQLAEQVAQRSMDNVVEQIMHSDPNQDGAQPASKKSIDSLSKGNYETLSTNIECQDLKLVSKEGKRIYLEEAKNNCNSNDCSVCKEKFDPVDSELTRMPCMHIFHNACILPWLEKHNSCPTCRFELPTYDEDYQPSKNSNPTPPSTGETIIQDGSPTGESNSPPAPAIISTHSFNITHSS